MALSGDEFPPKVIEFCEKENYRRKGPVTEMEFSQVAHKLYGIFFTSDMSLERMIEVSNCTLYARIRGDE